MEDNMENLQTLKQACLDYIEAITDYEFAGKDKDPLLLGELFDLSVTAARKVARLAIRFSVTDPAEQTLWHYDAAAIWAVRYCLGRRTYAVSECCSWLRSIWDTLDPHAKSIIASDIDEEIERDDRARASGSDYRPLGDDCDRREWLAVRSLWLKAPC